MSEVKDESVLTVHLIRSPLGPLGQWFFPWFVVSCLIALMLGLTASVLIRHTFLQVLTRIPLFDVLPIGGVWALLLWLYSRAASRPALLTVREGNVTIVRARGGELLLSTSTAALTAVSELYLTSGKFWTNYYPGLRLQAGEKTVRVHIRESSMKREPNTRTSGETPDFELSVADFEKLLALFGQKDPRTA